MTETSHMPPTYATATLRRRLKNLVSVSSPPPFSVFAKLQYHNHYWEIENDYRELRYLVEHTDAARVSLLLDVGWVNRVNGNPAQAVALFRARIAAFHLRHSGRLVHRTGTRHTRFCRAQTRARGIRRLAHLRTRPGGR